MKAFLLAVALTVGLTALVSAQQPMTAKELAAVRGRGTPLQDFLANAQRTSPAPGVTIYTWSSDGNPFRVTATWNTGSSTGTATIVK